MTDPALKIIPDKQLRFARPTLSAGGLTFTWPVGPEGFRRSGTATVGIHHYIGGSAAVANVIHFDEGHIEMNGTLPGLSSPGNMVNLIDVLTSRNKKVLSMPGVFPRSQYVEVENYDFTHSPDDRTHSIEYSISFLKVTDSDKTGGGFVERSLATAAASTTKPGVGVQQFGAGASSLELPTPVSRPSKSQSARYFQVIDGVDTFRMIAAYVYGDSSLVRPLIRLNQNVISQNNPGTSINSYELIYHRWPRGTRIAY